MKGLRSILTIALVAALLPSPAAAADGPRAEGPIKAAIRNVTWQAAGASQPHHGRNTFIGAMIGAGSAAAVTYWAAKTYGENEPGGFCEGCFLQWGAWAIPAGALIGAAVGSVISHVASPQRSPRPGQTFIAPVASRRAAGVVVSFRY
jgi:hypothetical protein